MEKIAICPCAFMFFELLKLVLPIIAGAITAWLGFRAGCKRDDNALKSVVVVKINLLLRQVAKSEGEDIADIHRKNVPRLMIHVFRALARLQGKEEKQAREAWDAFESFDASLHPCEELIADIKSKQMSSRIIPLDEIAKTPRKGAFIALLFNLKQAFGG